MYFLHLNASFCTFSNMRKSGFFDWRRKWGGFAKMQFLVIQICPPCRKGTSQLLISYTHTRTQKLSMFVFTLLNALSYFHFLFQVQIKTWFLYTLRTSFEMSKQTCMYSYTNILSTLLLTYILQCKNKEYSSFVIISCKVYLKVMNNSLIITIVFRNMFSMNRFEYFMHYLLSRFFYHLVFI